MVLTVADENSARSACVVQCSAEGRAGDSFDFRGQQADARLRTTWEGENSRLWSITMCIVGSCRSFDCGGHGRARVRAKETSAVRRRKSSQSSREEQQRDRLRVRSRRARGMGITTAGAQDFVQKKSESKKGEPKPHFVFGRAPPRKQVQHDAR